ncbi:unnamed protein product [Rhodiola kirilowii]
MDPMERQLGHYKRYARNTRYSEGCIAKQYVAQECVTYCKLYMGEIEDTTMEEDEEEWWNILVVSNVIKPMGYLKRRQLLDYQIDVAHWCVLENCEEATEIINKHMENYFEENPYGDNDQE